MVRALSTKFLWLLIRFLTTMDSKLTGYQNGFFQSTQVYYINQTIGLDSGMRYWLSIQYRNQLLLATEVQRLRIHLKYYINTASSIHHEVEATKGLCGASDFHKV